MPLSQTSVGAGGAGPGHHGLRGHDLARPAQRLEAGRHVHRRPHHPVLDALGGADVAGDHLAVVQADPHGERGEPGPAVLGVERGQRLLHGPGAPDRPLGVVGSGQGGAEEHQDRVADELVDQAAVLQDHRRHAAQVPVEHGDHHLRAQRLGQRREAAQVRHQDRHRPQLAAQAQGVRVAQEPLGHLGAHVAAERLADEVAVAPGPGHVGHRPGEDADLVAAPRGEGEVEPALADARRGSA
jgi:hypothetical protein